MRTPPSPLTPDPKQDAYAYIQVSMGMIHPDYVYINHFLHERNEEISKHVKSESKEERQTSISSIKEFHTNSEKGEALKGIQVHFRSRKEVR